MSAAERLALKWVLRWVARDIETRWLNRSITADQLRRGHAEVWAHLEAIEDE